MDVMTFQVETLDSEEALRDIEPEWHALETAAGTGLPFMTWEWAWSWWLHFREDKSTIRDSLCIRTVRSESGELLGIAPLMLTQRPAVGPFRFRQLQFLGADPNVTELRGVLCRPGTEEVVYGALADQLMAEQDSWDWIMWCGIPAHTGAAAALEERGGMEFGPEVPAFLLPLAPTWEEFRSGLKRNIKESLRKCYNSLKRDGHSFEIEVVRERDEIPAAVEEFLRLHSARADLEETVRHADVFASAAAKNFLVDVCQRLADRDATRIFLMRIAGKVVAVRIGFQLGDVIYLYYSGFDPDWGNYSVMTTTVAEAIRYAIENGMRAVHLSTGRDVSKTRWGPEEIVYRQGVQLSPSPRARFAYSAFQYARKAAQTEAIQAVSQKLMRRSE